MSIVLLTPAATRAQLTLGISLPLLHGSGPRLAPVGDPAGATTSSPSRLVAHAPAARTPNLTPLRILRCVQPFLVRADRADRAPLTNPSVAASPTARSSATRPSPASRPLGASRELRAAGQPAALGRLADTDRAATSAPAHSLTPALMLIPRSGQAPTAARALGLFHASRALGELNGDEDILELCWSRLLDEDALVGTSPTDVTQQVRGRTEVLELNFRADPDDALSTYVLGVRQPEDAYSSAFGRGIDGVLGIQLQTSASWSWRAQVRQQFVNELTRPNEGLEVRLMARRHF